MEKSASSAHQKPSMAKLTSSISRQMQSPARSVPIARSTRNSDYVAFKTPTMSPAEDPDVTLRRSNAIRGKRMSFRWFYNQVWLRPTPPVNSPMQVANGRVVLEQGERIQSVCGSIYVASLLE
jgi:hypothetical protein